MGFPKKLKPKKRRHNRRSSNDPLAGMSIEEMFDENGKFKFEVKTYPQAIVDHAFELYSSGLSAAAIADKWGIKYRAVEGWCEEYGWVDRLSKIKEKAKAKHDEVLVNKKAEEQTQADERHKYILRWLTTEVGLELKTPSSNKTDEERKLVRMRTLKIATECYQTIIDQERKLLGMGDSVNKIDLPTNFTYKVVAKGQEVEGDDLQNLLTNQNPHKFNNDVITPTVLSLPDGGNSQSEMNRIPHTQQRAAAEPVIISDRVIEIPADPAKTASANVYEMISEENYGGSQGFTGFNQGY